MARAAGALLRLASPVHPAAGRSGARRGVGQRCSRVSLPAARGGGGWARRARWPLGGGGGGGVAAEVGLAGEGSGDGVRRLPAFGALFSAFLRGADN